MAWARFVVVISAAAAACGNGGRGSSDAAVADAHLDTPIADAMMDGRADAFPDAEVIPGGPPLGECRDGWCWVTPRPQGNALRGIWGASTSDVWVLGDRSTLMHYDGNAWRLYPSNSPGWGIFGDGQLWGTSSKDVWAAADTGGVLHWNGTSWSVAYAAGDARVIGGTGPSNVWAYDESAKRIIQWNGATWTPRDMPAPSWGDHPIAFGGMFGRLIAVSESGGIAEWFGTSWDVLSVEGHPADDAVVFDASHVVLVHSTGADFWDGNHWTSPVGPGGSNWYRITGRQFSDVWIADTGNDRAHWNGAAWSLTSDVGGGPAALWEDLAGELWVALLNSQVRVFDGNTWSEKTLGGSSPTAVWGTAEDDIWATVPAWQAPQMLHWDGNTWTSVPLPSSLDRPGGRLWGSARDDYWLPAGTWNSSTTTERMLAHWDGSAWTAFGPYGSEDATVQYFGFQGVWGAAKDDVYAVGATALYHYDGNAWTQVPDVPGGTDVFGSGAGDVYVVDGTALWHWNGLQWSSTTMPSAEAYGWINGPGDVWLAGIYGPGYHYDGVSFVQYSATSEGLPAGTANDMFTLADVGGLDMMTEWVGGVAGTNQTTLAPFALWGGWRAPDGHVYATGAGLLVH